MNERDVHYELMRGGAMLDEMEKVAGVGAYVKSLIPRPGTVGFGRLMGAGIGSVGGAVGGATLDEDPQRGAIRGALYGGLAGLAGGQLATKGGRGQVKRIGQRQLHGMTGYVPRTQAMKNKGVSWTGKGLSKSKRIQALKGMGIDVGSSPVSKRLAVRKSMDQQEVSKNLPKSWRKAIAEREVAGAAARRTAAEQGLTSIPGVVKGMATRPIHTLKTGFVGQGPLGMALGTLPAVASVPGAVTGKGFGEEYSQEGGMGRLVGENLGYAAFGATPFLPLTIGAGVAAKAGELAHSKAQGLRGAKRHAG